MAGEEEAEEEEAKEAAAIHKAEEVEKTADLEVVEVAWRAALLCRVQHCWPDATAAKN